MTRSFGPPSPSNSAPETSASGQQVWTVGTLKYTKGGLIILFFWLMWNDFFIGLMEMVKPTLTGILMKDHGASNTEIALYLSTLSAILTTWINPVVSTWSDRTRTRLGRRRPFLLLATPPAALFLALVPHAPKAWEWLMTIPWFADLFGNGSINGPVLAIGICAILFSFFNSVLLAIFTYYFWDVVPEAVLGRFNAVAKIVTTIKTFIWNYWIFGYSEQYIEWIYGVIAALFLIVYMTTLLVTKEGNYPPPEPRAEGKGYFAPVYAYFSECFGKSYYLWVYAGFTAMQLANIPNLYYRIFHWRDTLGLDLDIIGKMQAWPSLGIVLLGFPLGALVDKVNPIRVIICSLFAWSATNVACFFFLKGATSLLVFLSLITIWQFTFGVSVGLLTLEVFPREKIGQFCSANAITQQVSCLICGPFVGMFLDYIKSYTCVYLWSAVLQCVSALIFIKVYTNWRRRQQTASVELVGA